MFLMVIFWVILFGGGHSFWNFFKGVLLKKSFGNLDIKQPSFVKEIMESVLYGKTPLELINAENNSGYINVSVTFKMLSEQKNKQKGKWVDDIIETKKAFDTLESRNTKTKGLDLDINVYNYYI